MAVVSRSLYRDRRSGGQGRCAECQLCPMCAEGGAATAGPAPALARARARALVRHVAMATQKGRDRR